MSKLIQKAGFLNTKRAGRYMNYIATRDGVELLEQLHEVSGVRIPERLAALRGKDRRFDLTAEREAMDSVVLDFLR